MKGINKVTLLGFLGKDAEIRYLPDGTPMAVFTLATKESYKDRQGNWQEKTEWHNLRVLGERAPNAQELKKGDRVYLEGKIQTREWTTNGETHRGTEILVWSWIVLSPQRTEDRTEKQPPAAAPVPLPTGIQLEDGTYISDADIPF